MAPSLLSADFSNLRADIAAMAAAGVDLLHLDVMDAHFVPNLTFGPFICEAIRRASGDLVLDAHLMMTNPERYLEPFAASGVDAITVHVEADCPLPDTLVRIRELGIKPGISLNPGTPVDRLEGLLAEVDLVLVMTVEPGFGGQSFDETGVQKIAWLADRRARDGWSYAISVDGGINETTGVLCREAGADILVSGSWFCQADDRARAAGMLRGDA